MVLLKSSHIGKVFVIAVAAGLILSQSGQLFAQGSANQSAPDTPIELREPSRTDHSITIEGQTIEYTATVGHMVQKDDDGKILGYLFYTAYVKKNRDAVSHPPDLSKNPVFRLYVSQVECSQDLLLWR